jgi:hypothetical protein
VVASSQITSDLLRSAEVGKFGQKVFRLN